MSLSTRVAAAAIAGSLALAGTGLVVSTGLTSAATPRTGPVTSHASAARSLHRFQGTITAYDRTHHWLRMRTTSHHTIQVYVNGSTHWDGCDWGDMHHGYGIQVRAYSSHHRWIASTMQAWHHAEHHHMGMDD